MPQSRRSLRHKFVTSGFSPNQARFAAGGGLILAGHVPPVSFEPPPSLRLPLRLFVAGVWFVNGLGCKVLDVVPRHRQIVERVLGLAPDDATLLTKAIGFGEILIGLWVLTGLCPRLATWFQIALVATMNVLEFWLAPDLLLYGRANLPVALVFIGVLYLQGLQPNTAKGQT